MPEPADPASGHLGAWRYSTLESFYADPLASLEEPCEVVITAERISLSHVDSELGSVVFEGDVRGAGHYVLRAAHGAGGTLHALTDSPRLEGYWSDRGRRGMWTVTLSDDPADG